jgi:hypothetical protein
MSCPDSSRVANGRAPEVCLLPLWSFLEPIIEGVNISRFGCDVPTPRENLTNDGMWPRQGSNCRLDRKM